MKYPSIKVESSIRTDLPEDPNQHIHRDVLLQLIEIPDLFEAMNHRLSGDSFSCDCGQFHGALDCNLEDARDPKLVQLKRLIELFMVIAVGHSAFFKWNLR